MKIERTSSEEESIKILFISTFVLVICLIQRLRQVHKLHIFCLFLNNLFLNVNVVQVFLTLRICYTETIRKNV